MKFGENRRRHITLALLLPFAACAVQWQLWSVIKPFVWFLFFPTVFFSSRLGGKIVGFIATVISALLVVYFFIPPQLSLHVTNPDNLYSVILFLLMGVLFSLTHDNLEKAKKHAANALNTSRISNDQLQEANTKVTQLYEKTVRLDEMKTQFFANVSHELRTPLTLILGPVGRCLADSALRDENRHDLEVIERNARLLYRQVSDLLDVAKLEAGGMAPRYTDAELSGLVRFVASHFESRADEQEISFRIETPDELWAQVDTEKFRRILLNLLANAFKFTQVGGEIIVTLTSLDGTAILEVQDNGPGIPPDKREMVFERFSQVDGGTERRFGGTGLGLAIVREFADLHGGSAMVTEAPGGGALFTVTLPLRAPDHVIVNAPDDVNEELFQQLIPLGEPQRAATHGSSNVSRVPLILVVEDNVDMNGYITSLLGRHYRVASAFDGEEGLAMACSLKPDLLISDMMMPRMNGERLVQALRGQPGMNGLPIIMLTAKADDALRVQLLENGVQDYLTKPFSEAELMARVAVFLTERQRTSEELRESETQFSVMFQESSVGMSQADPRTGQFMRVNPALCRFIGYSEQNLLQMTICDITYAADRESSFNKLLALNEGAVASFQLEKRFVRSDNTIVYGDVTVNLVRDKSGKPLRTMAIIQDISSKRQAEEEVRQLNTTLEQRVAERTAELMAANRELDAFAYAVSHDLRAPLRAMNGFSQALVEDFGNELHGEASEYLNQITIASRHMGGLIEGLLTLSRSTRGELRRNQNDLSKTAELIRDELMRTEPERDVVWQIEPGMTANADTCMLEAVLRNLLGNAWKYTVGTSAPLIRFYAEETDGICYFHVADNGAGFDMRHAERLFKPFQRLHRQDEFPGIGIGLATVQRIIHRHGGEIHAEAQPGKGATFRFSLPSHESIGGISND
jgi:PAS domain S-box-containing protein